MRLGDFIAPEAVIPSLKAKSKKQLLQELSSRAARLTGLEERYIFDVLLQRERLGSTGLGQGIAIPHPRNPIVLRVHQPSVAICYLERPIDFGALDGKPVHTLVTLVSPSTRAHLHLLALVAAALRDPAVVTALERRAELEALVAEVARVEAEIAARRAGGAGK